MTGSFPLGASNRCLRDGKILARSHAIMCRRLFSFACLLSLLLCLATIGLWVRSYWRVDNISCSVWNGHAYVPTRSGRGVVELAVIRWPTPYTYPYKWASFSEPMSPVLASYLPSQPTFGFWTETFNGPEARHIVISDWLLVIVTGTLPTFWLWHWLRNRQRNRVGRCSTCGYDLRASPDRCPECGTPVPRVQSVR